MAHDLIGRLTTPEAIRRFIEGGNATFTIKNPTTETRFTYRARRPQEDGTARSRPIWLALLAGPDNESNYSYIGSIYADGIVYSPIRRSSKSRVSADAPSALALEWFLRNLNNEEKLAKIEVWHEGRCGRCGRKLTVPESVEAGFGPECINYV